MPRKKRDPLDFVEKMKRMHAAGIDKSVPPNHLRDENFENLPDLESRLQSIFQIAKNSKKDNLRMLFFVMYDIESDKVRRQIVKYLEREGCSRVQKSIFLADLPIEKYEQIKSDLAEVQACYENQDSILVVPISTDYLKAMKIIGQNIQIDVITKSSNTLFF